MKKIKITKLTFIFIVFIAVVSFVFAGCNCNSENNPYDDSGITISGTTDSDEDEKIRIIGAEDIHVKKGIEEDDVIITATAKQNGASLSVKLDLSAANLNEKGVYDVTYCCNEIKVVKKIYVYDEPSFTFDDEKAGKEQSLDYCNALSGGLYSGVTGKDCFGNKLDVVITDDGGLINGDGSYNCLPEYRNVILKVTDKAGQALTLAKRVKITMTEPQIEEYSARLDVADEEFSIRLASGASDDFLGCSVNGVLLPSSMIRQNEDGKIVIPAECFEEYSAGETFSVRVITYNGHAEKMISVIDEKPVSFSDAEIKAFVMQKQRAEETIDIPEIRLLNKRQQVTPTYSITKKDGSKPLTITEGKVVFPYETERGCVWTLKVSLRNGETLCYDINSYYDVGLRESEIYSPQHAFELNIKKEYKLTSLRVYFGTVQTLFYDAKTDEFADFKDKLHALNTAKVYELEARTEKNSRNYVQSVSFRVVKNGFGILGSENDLIEGKASARSSARLNYMTAETGGRSGLVKWVGTDKNSSAQNSKINFSSDIASDMKKGGFLYFDIYLEDADLYFYYTIKDDQGKNADWFLWRSGTPDSKSYKNFEENIKFYDEKGNIISGDVLRNISNAKKWITVEIKLNGDFGTTEYNGLSVYPIGSLYGHDVYLSYIRYSETSLYDDDTENPVYDPKVADAVVKDIWKDIKEVW